MGDYLLDTRPIPRYPALVDGDVAPLLRLRFMARRVSMAFGVFDDVRVEQVLCRFAGRHLAGMLGRRL